MPIRRRGGALALKRGGRADGGAMPDEDYENTPLGPKYTMKVSKNTSKGRDENNGNGALASGDQPSAQRQTNEKMGPYSARRADGGGLAPFEDKKPKGRGPREGAASGESRLSKIKMYGDNSDDGEDGKARDTY